MVTCRRLVLGLACFVLALPLMGQDDSACSTETVDEPDKPGQGGGEERRPKAQLGDSLTLEGTDRQAD